MIDFLIKSTISLGILYVFYNLVLSGLKTFKFNRYFLLASLVFSLVIPLISIPVDTNVVPIMNTTGVTSLTGTIDQTSEFVTASNENGIISANLLLYIYVTISLILLIRFGLNLSSIIKTIGSNHKEHRKNYSLVLVTEQVLPHTFFNHIMVNKEDYERGRIDKALLRHEVTHCVQWHSIDIILIELLKVVLWINPFVWWLKKPIQLNHEYLADVSVLADHNINRYQNILINIVLGNSNGILASHFNFSLTKQRIKMMTKHYSPVKGVLGKISSIFVLLLIAITLSCSQESIEHTSFMDNENEWWQPILKVHGIEPTAYNNFENIFEMGSTNSIKDGVVTLEDALIILKSNLGYSILKSPLAYHDLNKKTISAKEAIVEFYEINESGLVSKEVTTTYRIEGLIYNIGEKTSWSAAYAEWD